MTRGSDNPAGFLIFALGVLAAITIAALWGAFRVIRRTRLLENTPTSKIRSAPQGYVELVGSAQWLPDRHTKSPLSGTECIWWSCTVEKRAHDPRGRDTWQIIDQRSSNERFALIDDTGSCTVDPLGAELIGADLKAGGDLRQWYGTTPQPRPNSAAGTSGEPPRGEPAFRYRERSIARGVTLQVLGEFHTRHTADADPVHTVAKPRQSGRPFVISTSMQHELTDGSRTVAIFLLVCAAFCGVPLVWAIGKLLGGTPIPQILFGLLAAFGVALFLILSVGPLVTGLRRLFGAPNPAHSRASAIPLLAFSLLAGALTGILVLWAAQQAG